MSGTREQSEPSTATLTANRPHYDVDDFKRLLLTGEKVRTDKNTSTATVPPAPMQGLQLGDSNSNTDASSVSRQSIFEPHPDLNPESPSTSMDVPLSDDERHGLVQSSPNVGRSRPSVPPSRHGKLVKQTVPQTVAFENLSSSPPGPSLPPISFMESSPLATLDTSRDIDKPLPLPPQTESPKSMESRSGYTSSAAEAPHRFSTTENHTDRVATKRSAPPLPAARRHGQARSRSSTNDSSRSTSITEEMSQHTLPSPTNSSSTTSLKPPLPPPRRTGTNPGQENTNPATAVATVNDPVELPASKARPPAPPSRTPSTTSIKRMSRAPTNPGSPAPAPPPPPRRRGSSQSQSSFIPSRLSGEYRISSSERARSGSGASSTQQPSLPEAPTEEKDIMADLTALQREVDELRGKFGR